MSQSSSQRIDTVTTFAQSTPEEHERVARIQLAAAYRLVDYFGWTELIYGHLTYKLPGDESHFLINPYGLNYDEVTASNLVKIDLDGNVIGHSDYPVNYAGFVIHSAIHMAKSVNKCVMHTHTRAGMAVAGTQEGLQQISMMSTAFHDRIAYHDYEGVSLYLDERERLLANLGDKRAMILRNHGILTVGQSIPETFLRLYRLERACQIQVDAGSAGTMAVMPPEVSARSGRDMDAFSERETNEGVGAVEFAALMRKLDKIDTSYRD